MDKIQIRFEGQDFLDGGRLEVEINEFLRNSDARLFYDGSLRVSLKSVMGGVLGRTDKFFEIPREGVVSVQRYSLSRINGYHADVLLAGFRPDSERYQAIKQFFTEISQRKAVQEAAPVTK